MESKDLISIEEICKHYDIPKSFIQSLEEIELIKTTTLKKTQYIEITYVKNIEKMIRLHYELNINIEGLDVVNNLLEQVTQLQEEIHELKNRLKVYEES